MRVNKQLFSLAVAGILIVLTLFLLRDFNMVWIKVNEDYATITINFLMPMEKERFEESIKIESSKLYENTFATTINWKGPHTCTITLREEGAIKGQKVILHIAKAPTRYKGLSKNATIPIQFQTEVKVIEPKEEILTTTHLPFQVRFNTPMDVHIIQKYLQSDGQFIIEPVNGDLTLFNFTPKVQLENDRKYLLSFRKGMTSKSGNILEEDYKVFIRTDKRPKITEITPESGSQWVGLYPRINLRSEDKINKAFLYINNTKVEGEVKNEFEAIFYPPYVLEAQKEYKVYMQTQAVSGELSEKIPMTFKTVPIKEGRVWVDVLLDKQELRIYNGKKEIKRMQCSTGVKKSPTSKGTYYVVDKIDSQFDEINKEGANYWFILSEGIVIHGMSRTPNWEFKSNVYNAIGSPQTKGKIILKEEDALWLYENIQKETMVIIHH